MAKRKGETLPRPTCHRLAQASQFLVLLFLVFSAGGCAAPGEPSPRRSAIPEAVTDLAAGQSGEDVILTFTPPKATAAHEPLTKPPAIEVYRDFRPAPAPGTSVAAPPQGLLVTIPPEMVDRYVEEGHLRLVNTLKAEELAQHAGEIAVYDVRTGSKKKESADSNLAVVRLNVPPEPIGDLQAKVTQTAITISWTPPQKTVLGGALPPLEGYRVNRVEVEAAASSASNGPPSGNPPGVQTPTTSPFYQDTQFEFGRTYIYTVRSIAQFGSDKLESAPSHPLELTPKDTFPPAAPQGLEAVMVPAVGETPAHPELSWAISPEPDLAGYSVYRSEEPNGLTVRLNTALLLTPAFRDMSTVPGRRYTYTVTAVDHAGNESLPSAAASAGVPESNFKEEERP